jgi:hypothetical protein
MQRLREGDLVTADPHSTEVPPPGRTPAEWRTLTRLGNAVPAAHLWTGNPAFEALPDISAWPEGRAVVWSGSLAEGDPFAEELRNWMSAGREALESWCDRLVGPLASTGRTLLIRPHARQLLNDVAGVVRFLRRHRGERFGMAIAPIDLLTEEMRDDAAEHLRRSFEVLGPILVPDRDLLIAPAETSCGDAAQRSREACFAAANAHGLEVATDA